MFFVYYSMYIVSCFLSPQSIEKIVEITYTSAVLKRTVLFTKRHSDRFQR